MSIKRARAGRSEAVAGAIQILGSGFIRHPGNAALRTALSTGVRTPEAYGRQLQILVFRLLFLMLAEERELLHPPGSDPDARAQYESAYALRRLPEGAPHAEQSDDDFLWPRLGFVFSRLASPDGGPELGLPHLGSYLCSDDATPDLLARDQATRGDAVCLRDADLLGALRLLGDARGPTPTDADACDAPPTDDLGSLYESVLALRAGVDTERGAFTLTAAPGGARRSTGSFYTPEALVAHLLGTALDPVIHHRLEQADSVATASARDSRVERERALLSITVCDPACGSGRFLVGAARRLGDRLAQIRSGTSRPSPEGRQHALRDVIRSCLYGVDLDPLATELCKIALWSEMNQAGTPLSFLDHSIKSGNSLLGATPALVRAGIPDSAFAPQEGDDPRAARTHKSRNRQECRQAQNEPAGDTGGAEDPRLLADAWCASFLWVKEDAASPGAVPGCAGGGDAITEGVLRSLEREPCSVKPGIRAEIQRIAGESRFFHWSLEFPEVLGRARGGPTSTLPGERSREPWSHGAGGFDVVLGNPPFLNQLESATAAGRRAAMLMRACSGGAVRGYADIATAFLLLSIGITRAGGRVALVQPQSLLAAKDAGAARASVLRQGSLCSLWVSREHIFPAASVFTCAPTIHVGGPSGAPLQRFIGNDFAPLGATDIDPELLAEGATWSPLAAAAWGIPEIDVRERRVLGEFARATADFRDQYYGLRGFLVEDAQVTRPAQDIGDRFPPVVTAGLVDLARCAWGESSTRILKHTWAAPRVDRARMDAEGSLGPWIQERLTPKVLVATQTRVIEAFVDPDGALVPSTPLISVFPHRIGDIWRVAAALASPVCTAVALQRYAGAALNPDAIKLSARQVSLLPAPSCERAWDEGASSLCAAQSAQSDTDRADHLARFGAIMCRAYGLTETEASDTTAWWSRRLKGLNNR